MQSLITFLREMSRFLIPCVVVYTYQQALLFRLGRPVRLMTSSNGVRGTGLHLFVPLIHRADVQNTILEVLETTGQAVVTADLKPFTVSCSLSYEIQDLRGWFRVQDFDASLQAIVKAHLSAAFLRFQSLEIGDAAMRGALEDNARALVRTAVNEWGVEVLSLRLIDLTPSRTINLLTL